MCNMSEREEHNELIPQLAERLRNHTEPYKDGAWERFAAIHGRPRRRLWPYSAAAAVLLAAVGLYWATRDSNEPAGPPQVVHQEVAPKASAPSGLTGDGLDDTVTKVAVDRVVLPVDKPTVRDPGPVVAQLAAATPTGVPGDASIGEAVEDYRITADQPTVSAPPAADTTATEVAAGPEPPRRLVHTIEQEQPGRPVTDVRTSPKPGRAQEKWDLGLVLAPSLTSETLNIGGGLAVAYRLSDKLAIGSGISIAQLGVGENPNYAPQYSATPNGPTVGDSFNGKSELAVSYRREVSVTSNVVTLDIPLDIRYDVLKGFYTSVGMSYVAVLNEQRTSHFVGQINQNTFAAAHLSTADRLASTELVYSSEKVAAKPLRGKGYAGFLNFSIGKKMPISNKLFLSVEPYFKLPVGRLAEEEMNFTNGGIRIVTGF